MSRPLRIEFPGALYHLTSRGDGRDDIYLHDEDRLLFLSVLGQVCERFNWECHSYCLMTNHYHLMIETPDGNLSQGMRNSMTLDRRSYISSSIDKCLSLCVVMGVQFIFQNWAI